MFIFVKQVLLWYKIDFQEVLEESLWKILLKFLARLLLKQYLQSTSRFLSVVVPGFHKSLVVLLKVSPWSPSWKSSIELLSHLQDYLICNCGVCFIQTADLLASFSFFSVDQGWSSISFLISRETKKIVCCDAVSLVIFLPLVSGKNCSNILFHWMSCSSF